MVLFLLLGFFFCFCKICFTKTIIYRIRQVPISRLKQSSGKTIVPTYIYRNLEYKSFFSNNCFISYFSPRGRIPIHRSGHIKTQFWFIYCSGEPCYNFYKPELTLFISVKKAQSVKTCDKYMLHSAFLSETRAPSRLGSSGKMGEFRPEF